MNRGELGAMGGEPGGGAERAVGTGASLAAEQRRGSCGSVWEAYQAR